MKIDVTERWRWFSAEDAIRWALGAYYTACKDIQPPPDDPEPELWSSRGCFAWAFHAALTRRICAEARAAKIPDDAGNATEILRWADSVFNRPEGKTLPPEDNALHNAPTEACRHV